MAKPEQVKCFEGIDIDTLESKVNTWLSVHSEILITQRTQSSCYILDAPIGSTTTISIWYKEN